MGENVREQLVFDDATANRLVKEISDKVGAVADVIKKGNLDATRKAIEPIIVGLSDNLEGFLSSVKGRFAEHSKEWNQVEQFQKNIREGRVLARKGNASQLMSTLLTVIALYLPTTLEVEFKEKENLELFTAAVESLQSENAAVAVYKRKFKDLKIEVTKHEYEQNNTIEGATDQSDRLKRDKERKAHKSLKQVYTEMEKKPVDLPDESGLMSDIVTVEHADDALDRVDIAGFGRVLAALPLPKNTSSDVSRRREKEEVKKLYADKTDVARIKIKPKERVALELLTQTMCIVSAKNAMLGSSTNKKNIVLTPAEQYIQAVLGVAKQGKAAEGRLYRTALTDRIRLEQVTQVYTVLETGGDMSNLLPGMFEVVLNNDLDNLIEAPSKDTDLSSLRAIRKYQRVGTGKKKNPVGTGTLMEGQKAKMFETVRQHMIDTKQATEEQADGWMVEHIAEIIAMDPALTKAEKEELMTLDTPKKLYRYFLSHPASITQLRRRIEQQPEYFMSMLEYGKAYLSYEAEKIRQKTALAKSSPEDLLRETIKDYDALDGTIKKQLIDKVDDALAPQRETIDEQIALIDKELAKPDVSKATEKALKQKRKELTGIKATMTSEEYKTRVARTTRGLALTNVDDLTSVGVGAARQIAFSKGWLAQHLVDNITFSGGVLQGLNGLDGKILDNDLIGTNLALGVSFGKTWDINKEKNMTLFYTVGVGGGLNLQSMTIGWAPYLMVGTAREKNGVTWFAGANASLLPGAVSVGVSTGVKLDVIKNFNDTFEKIKGDLTNEVKGIVSAAKGDFSYGNMLKIVETKFKDNEDAEGHLSDYARILSDILQQVASDAELKKNLTTNEGIELISTMISGVFMDSYNRDISKLAGLQLTGGCIGVQLIFTPWGIGVIPTGGLFFSMIKKGAYVPDKGSYDREQKFKERLSGAQETDFTFANIDEVNVLLRTQDRDDKTDALVDLPGVSDAKLEVRGDNQDYVFVPQSFFEYFNLELGTNVPYMRLDGSENVEIPQATDKIGVLLPAKAKPVVMREFFGNHQVLTLAVVSQLSDPRERVLPNKGTPSEKAALDEYNKGLVEVQTYLASHEHIKQTKEGMLRFNEGAEREGGRPLFDAKKDPIMDMPNMMISFPLLKNHGITVEKIDKKYAGRIVVKNIGGQDYLVMPGNMSIQFIQAKDQTRSKGSKKTYLLVKSELPVSKVPRWEMSLQMTESFEDELTSELSEIVSPNPDRALLDFLKSGDAAEMFMRWRYERKGGKDMHEVYYAAVDAEKYSEAAKIAVEYIDEAISKSSGTEKTRLQALRPQMAFDAGSKDPAVKERTIANIHYIYAALSRVTMTEKKHLTIDGAGTELDDLIKNLPAGKYKAETLAKLKEVGHRVLKEDGAFDSMMSDEQGKQVKVSTWLEKTLNVSYSAAGRGATEARHISGGKTAPIKISPEYRIAFLLIKMEQVAIIRTESYKKRLEKEPQYANNPAAVEEHMKIRMESIKGMPNRPLANGNTEQLVNAASWVAGYGGFGNTNLHIDEKFVFHPYIVKGSERVIDKAKYPQADVHKQHFLDNLQQKNPEILDSIARQIVGQLKANGFPTDRLEKKGGGYNYENLKKVIIGDGKLNGRAVPGLEEITSVFVFAIFPECINEEVILKSLKMKFSKRVPYVPKLVNATPIATELVTTPVSRKLAYVNYTVANTAVRQQKDLPTLGVAVGKIPKPKAGDETGSTEPTLQAPEEFGEIDTSKATFSSDFDFTVGGVAYTDRPGFTLPDGTQYAKDIQGNWYKIKGTDAVPVKDLQYHLSTAAITTVDLLDTPKQTKIETSYLSGDDPDASELELELDNK